MLKIRLKHFKYKASHNPNIVYDRYDVTLPLELVRCLGLENEDWVDIEVKKHLVEDADAI